MYSSVLAGDKYTVELFGAGYVTYKKTGVTFENAVEITNAEFIPGNVNGDGKVDADDKAAAEKSQNEEFNDAADFDRNGKTEVVNKDSCCIMGAGFLCSLLRHFAPLKIDVAERKNGRLWQSSW